MRNIIKSMLCIMVIGAAIGCDNLYNDITDELSINYFHGTRQFIASDGASGDQFGYSVAVSADGSTVVVGADTDDVGSNANQGSAYVYRWNGSSWVQVPKLTASDGAASDYFGWSVAVSEDGNTVVVGAVGDDSSKGSAYVYRWNGSSYSQVEPKLQASDGALNDYFGCSVTVSANGDTVVVGAYRHDSNKGSAYVYRWNGSSYLQTEKLTGGAAGDWFGSSVAVSADGSTVVIGALGVNSSIGAAYVYRWNGSSYVQAETLTASGGTSGDSFGNSVAVSGDGGIVVVGASNDNEMGMYSGSSWVYRWNGSSYEQARKLTGTTGEQLGTNVAVSSDGTAVAVGAPNSTNGYAWLYAE